MKTDGEEADRNIGDVAEASGLPVKTIRYYEDIALVRPSYSSSGHLTYEIAGNDHHHVVCRICGDEIAVEHALLESLYRLLETTSGYRSINSHVTFFGVCPECQKTHSKKGD